ncbi:MAG: hypothetical protein JNN15_17955, partial [Blastocatellia bacterium]|nr:hypothetical protein [Blastocatellia bacterium]
QGSPNRQRACQRTNNHDHDKAARSIAGLQQNILGKEWRPYGCRNLANQKPLVILLDNLDLAGSEILDFLTYLIGTAAKEKILLILTLNIQNTVRKDSRIATWINRLANLRQLQRLHLEQLSHLEMEAYIYKLFSPNCFSEDFLQKLYLISDGNPFYLTETVKNIVAKGEIYWNKQQWNNSEIGEIVLSESIKEKIEERFSLLSTLAKDTLRLAAILGKFFCFEVLKEFSNLNEEKMIQIIDESVNFQLIAEYDAQDEKSFNFDFYTFNGRTAHQYLYKSWPKEELVEQHLKAASVFRGFSKDTIWQRSQTAYHLFAAGKFEEAFCEFVTAAATSWKTGDLVAARQSLKDASLSIDQAGFATITQHINKESSKLANHLCDFLMLSVDLNTLPISIQTEEQLEQVLMLAQTIGDKTLIARAFVTCGHYQRSQGNGDSAIGYFEQALGFYAATKNLHRYNILLEQLNSLRAEIRSEKPTVEF